MGVTSVRDPGNDDVRTMDRRARVAAGELLFPHVYPSSLIDGKGPYTAQVANVATSEAEAVALVDKAKANGFIGVKFYGTLQPGVAAGRASPRRTSSASTCTATSPPASGRWRRSRTATTRSRTSTGCMMQAMPDSVLPVSQWDHAVRRPGPLCERRRSRRPRAQDDRLHDGGEAHLQRSDDGRVRELVCAGQRRPVAVLRAFRRHDAADDGARLPERRVRGAEGSRRARTTAPAGRRWSRCSGGCTRPACRSSRARTAPASS